CKECALPCVQWVAALRRVRAERSSQWAGLVSTADRRAFHRFLVRGPHELRLQRELPLNRQAFRPVPKESPQTINQGPINLRPRRSIGSAWLPASTIDSLRKPGSWLAWSLVAGRQHRDGLSPARKSSCALLLPLGFDRLPCSDLGLVAQKQKWRLRLLLRKYV